MHSSIGGEPRRPGPAGRLACEAAFLAAALLTRGTVVAAPEGSSESARPPASAVIVSVEGRAWVVRADGAGSVPATLGLRLRAGEQVVAEESGAAAIYFSGGHIARVPGGSRLEIVSDPAEATASPSVAKMSDGSLKILEEGLWLLSDPAGAMLLGGMRGPGEAAQTPGPGAVPANLLLSPRWEKVLATRPAFVWASEEPAVRIAVEHAGRIVWRSPALRADTWSADEDGPPIQPGRDYRWWLESADSGVPLAEPVSFLVPTVEEQKDIVSFESSMRELSTVDANRITAALLRCAFYERLGSWSRVLREAHYLSSTDVGRAFGGRIVDLALRHMQLDATAGRQVLEIRPAPGAPEGPGG